MLFQELAWRVQILFNIWSRKIHSLAYWTSPFQGNSLIGWWIGCSLFWFPSRIIHLLIHVWITFVFERLVSEGLLSVKGCCHEGLLVKGCCQRRTVVSEGLFVSEGLLSVKDCCQWGTVVNEGLLSVKDCCQWGTVVSEGLLSWRTVVSEGLLSVRDCCQWRTVVSEGLPNWLRPFVGTCWLWTGRDAFTVTPTVTGDLSFHLRNVLSIHSLKRS